MLLSSKFLMPMHFIVDNICASKEFKSENKLSSVCE